VVLSWVCEEIAASSTPDLVVDANTPEEFTVTVGRRS
jgi:hypothetical protein